MTWEAAENGPSTWVLAIRKGDLGGFAGSVTGLAHTWLLQPFAV